MIRRHLTALRLGLLATDAATAVVLFAVLSLIRFGDDWPRTWRDVGVDPIGLAAIWAIVWVSALWLMDLYRLRARWSIRSEAKDILQASMLIAVASFSALFLFKLPDVSRLFLISLFAAQTLLTFVLRLGMRWTLRELRNRGYNTRYLLVVGTGKTARSFADRVERHRELGLRVVGHLAIDAGEPQSVGRLAGARRPWKGWRTSSMAASWTRSRSACHPSSGPDRTDRPRSARRSARSCGSRRRPGSHPTGRPPRGVRRDRHPVARVRAGPGHRAGGQAPARRGARGHRPCRCSARSLGCWPRASRGRRPPGVVPPGPGRPARASVPGRQVPHDGPGRGGAPGRPGRSQRDQRAMRSS